MRGSFHIVWNWPALAIFYKLPPHIATIIDSAVIRFAERGEGQLDWDAPHFLLVAGPYDVVINIDMEQGVVAVLGMYRAR